jgi:hypothetical protein
VVGSDRSIAEAPLRKQFTKLLLEPLKSFHAHPIGGPVIVIIDALDECGDPLSRKILLSLLAAELSKLPSMFRFIITSREEFDISAALSDQTNVLEMGLSILAESNETDIYSFLCSEIVTIQRHHGVYIQDVKRLRSLCSPNKRPTTCWDGILKCRPRSA